MRLHSRRLLELCQQTLTVANEPHRTRLSAAGRKDARLQSPPYAPFAEDGPAPGHSVRLRNRGGERNEEGPVAPSCDRDEDCSEGRRSSGPTKLPGDWQSYGGNRCFCCFGLLQFFLLMSCDTKCRLCLSL